MSSLLQSFLDKVLLPTSLSSQQLSAIEPSLLRQSLFSARTTNARYLASIRDQVSAILSAETDPATARVALRTALHQLEPARAEEWSAQGSSDQLTDLGSDTRLDLVLKTNESLARGYGRRLADSDPTFLGEWPAQELVRHRHSRHERDWPSRWEAAGGQFYDGRMIALKSDPLWSDLSAFGNPYPPFDYNSGMWVEDISRTESEDLGLLSPSEDIQPIPPEDLDPSGATLPPMPEDLRVAILDSLGPGYDIRDGVLISERPPADIPTSPRPRAPAKQADPIPPPETAPRVLIEQGPTGTIRLTRPRTIQEATRQLSELHDLTTRAIADFDSAPESERGLLSLRLGHLRDQLTRAETWASTFRP